MTSLDTFILYEAASGYSVFEVTGFESIGEQVQTAQEAVTEYDRFCRSVKLKAYHKFVDAEEAGFNINAVSEHSCSDVLAGFLEANLPKASKKATWQLGVVETNLANAITEQRGLEGIKVVSSDTVREIVRGIRVHFRNLIPSMSDELEVQTQTAAGHAYSRSKIKFNPARSDNMVIQTIALLDQLDKDLNTFAMRVREWYSWHFPELKKIVADNYMYARAAALVQDRQSLFSEGCEEKLAKLQEITGDEEQVKAIVAAAKTSMGMECSPLDMFNVTNFTQRLVALGAYRKQLATYLSDKMAIVAPNLSTLIGDTVAARLISKAGSLQSLAKAPASTVQILGAEKALFRALKTKGNTPKYGLIYASSFISRAETKHKGRISRYLANKCSIASRVDCFSDEPVNAYGKVLAEQVEERLAFYESGKAPRKNIDVMERVAASLKGADYMDIEGGAEEKKLKKKKKEKKIKKEKAAAADAAPDTPSSKKDKKDKKDKSEKKKKKKRDSEGGEAKKSKKAKTGE